MTLENITQQIEEKLKLAPPIGAVVKFDLGDDGVIVVDATAQPAKISHKDIEAATTFVLNKSVLEGFLSGTQDPTMAFMTGKLKVQGSMGLAMKINSILED